MVAFSSIQTVEEGHDNTKRFKGVSRILGPKWLRMPMINIGMFGVQIFWCLEMSYASPYLLSLGLSKSKMAIVFLAPPLSGLLVQPLIGVLADSLTSSFGRRRPFILGGTLICVISILLMGFTRPFAAIFTGWNNSANDILTVWLAVLSIYAADFSINAVQSSDRALLVDTVTWSEQPTANAWTARMQGVGSVLGFFVGNVDLPNLMPFFGDSQLKVLSVLLSGILLIAHLLTCIFVKERVLLKNSNLSEKKDKKSVYKELTDIWVNMRELPHVIRQICLIQLFSWIAWFPILFYSTLYVGELHKRNSPPTTSPQEEARLDSEAMRLGSRALFYSAVLSLVGSLVLPVFIPAPIGNAAQQASSRPTSTSKRFFAIPARFQIHLSTMWACGQVALALCMFSTLFAKTVGGATLILTATGIPGALGGWAPHTLLAQAILSESPIGSNSNSVVLHTREVAGMPIASDGDSETEILLQDVPERHSGEVEEGCAMLSNTNGGTNRHAGSLSAKAGIILGIHNTFIVIPQLIVTAISAILFALLDGGSSSNSEESRTGKQSNSLVYIFCIGGLSATYAFVLCWRLSRDLRRRY